MESSQEPPTSRCRGWNAAADLGVICMNPINIIVGFLVGLMSLNLF